MQPFRSVTGPAAPLPLANIDTDVIMPKRFLKGIDRAGLDAGVFADLRFDPAGRRRDEFVLNQAPWHGACFLVVGPNFGCGSSREHAVWGLLQLGIRAVLGTSFAGIFADNAANNGLLLISLPEPELARLMGRVAVPGANRLTVDLHANTIAAGEDRVPFTVEASRRERLLGGLDAIGAALRHADGIRAFEAARHAEHPWLA